MNLIFWGRRTAIPFKPEITPHGLKFQNFQNIEEFQELNKLTEL